MQKTQEAKIIVLEIINSFPNTEFGKHFLTLKNNKRIYFDVFIKKYGIDDTKCIYNDADVLRRIRIIEFLDYITKTFEIAEESHGLYIVKSKFYTLVCKNTHKKVNSKWQLISIFPHI